MSWTISKDDEIDMQRIRKVFEKLEDDKAAWKLLVFLRKLDKRFYAISNSFDDIGLKAARYYGRL